jgi:hypothetical protein
MIPKLWDCWKLEHAVKLRLRMFRLFTEFRISVGEDARIDMPRCSSDYISHLHTRNVHEGIYGFDFGRESGVLRENHFLLSHGV